MGYDLIFGDSTGFAAPMLLPYAINA